MDWWLGQRKIQEDNLIADVKILIWCELSVGQWPTKGQECQEWVRSGHGWGCKQQTIVISPNFTTYAGYLVNWNQHFRKDMICTGLYLFISTIFGISSRPFTSNDVKRLVNPCFLIGPHGFIHPLTSKWCWRMTPLSQHEFTAGWWSTRNLSSLYIYIHNYTIHLFILNDSQLFDGLTWIDT